MASDVIEISDQAAATLQVARVIEAKDPYTAGHTWRVANYGQILAAAMGYRPHQVEMMLSAGTLHDIGKLTVPDEILTKPGRLTDQEFEILKRHPEEGYNLLLACPEFSEVLNVVLHHHEAFDGGGYPHGLADDDIPHEARLFAIVDAFDAMTSNRCYRPAMPVDNAIYEIWRNRGRQFDPVIADAFIQLVRDGLVDQVIGYSDYGVKVGTCPRCGPVLEVHNGHRMHDEVVCKLCGGRFAIASKENGEFQFVSIEPSEN